jgi:hypothetical protein
MKWSDYPSGTFRGIPIAQLPVPRADRAGAREAFCRLCVGGNCGSDACHDTHDEIGSCGHVTKGTAVCFIREEDFDKWAVAYVAARIE